MQSLDLTEWNVGEVPLDVDENFIRISGSQGGFLGRILVFLEIDPTTSLKVSPERVEFTSGSLYGTEYRVIPLLSVCSTYSGYRKPWRLALAIAVLSFFLSSAVGDAVHSGGLTFFLFVLGVGVALLYYFLNRSLTLGFVEHSGVVSRVRFKRSEVEGVDVNVGQGHYICQIVQALIEARRNQV